MPDRPKPAVPNASFNTALPTVESLAAALLAVVLLAAALPGPELPLAVVSVPVVAERAPAKPVDANPPVATHPPAENDGEADNGAPSGAVGPADAGSKKPPEAGLPVAATPDGEADPAAEAGFDAGGEALVAVGPPVAPVDPLFVCDAVPEEADVPPGPLEEVWLEDEFELVDPLLPPVPAAPVDEGPLPPDEALPFPPPFDPPLEPPVDLLVDGPLLPPPGDEEATAGAWGAGGAVAGPPFKAATSTTLEIKPITSGHGTRSGQMRQPGHGAPHLPATGPPWCRRWAWRRDRRHPARRAGPRDRRHPARRGGPVLP